MVLNNCNPPSQILGESPVLAMSILVRDEADIIEDNILFHSRQGVDAFIVGDNGSTDGTREKVAKLAKTLPIHTVDFPDGHYQQTAWRTQMARLARKKYNARWVISNDADEFWFCESGNLKAELPPNKHILRAHRSNVLSVKGGKDYYKSPWRVLNPIHYRSRHQKQGTKMALALTKISPKVVVNPKGLLMIRGGAHRALHLFSWGVPSRLKNVLIYHFPIRGYDNFLDNARHRTRLLATDASTRFGPHNHRWVKLLAAGKLKQEYENLVYTEEELKVLERLEFVIKDTKLVERFKQLGLWRQGTK